MHARGRLIALLPFLVACGATTPSTAQDPAAVFEYAASADLELDTVRQADQGTVRMYAVSYRSPGGDRVTGLMAVPAGGGPKPAVVLLHGLPGNAQGAMNLLGLDYARRGAVTLAIDAPWVRRGGMPDFTVRDSVEQVQLMQDLRRAVDLLVSRPDVDAGRIGYIGGSYGGAMGALFVGIEKRLRAANLFVPDGGLVAHFTTADGTPLGPLLGATPATRERWLAAMNPIEPIRFVGRSSPTLLLIQNGRQDQLVANDDAEALHAAAGEPKRIIWYDFGHGLGSHPQARADRLAFFVEHLGIDGSASP